MTSIPQIFHPSNNYGTQLLTQMRRLISPPFLDATVFRPRNGKRIGIATSTNPKMCVTEVVGLGGYLQAGNGTADDVLQTVPLQGEMFGAVSSYPLEGGYICVNLGNTGLTAFAFSPNLSSTSLFQLCGQVLRYQWSRGHTGLPTVTSNKEQPGTDIVWTTDVNVGLRVFITVPIEDELVDLALPKAVGTVKFGRPVFGDGKVFVVDGMRRSIALGEK